jgi:hypothetical protein
MENIWILIYNSLLEKDGSCSSFKYVCLQDLRCFCFFCCYFLFVCFLLAREAGWSELSGLFQALAEGNVCKSTSGNHSVTRGEDFEKRSLTQSVYWDAGSTYVDTVDFSIEVALVVHSFLTRTTPFYMPSWISGLFHFGTLYHL